MFWEVKRPACDKEAGKDNGATWRKMARFGAMLLYDLERFEHFNILGAGI